jgi:hypothetical protein
MDTRVSNLQTSEQRAGFVGSQRLTGVFLRQYFYYAAAVSMRSLISTDLDKRSQLIVSEQS